MDDLKKIRQHIADLFGLSFPDNRLDDLERGIFSAATALGLPKDLNFMNLWLSQKSGSEEQMMLFSGHLTIGETYFFRESTGLNLLREKIIPEILEKRSGHDKYMRIWSAGCSSGEEPYTLAMIIHESVPDISNWNITLLATDISDKSLQKAARGIYGEWSFRDTPPEIKKKYFIAKEDKWEIIPEIKKMVSFSYLNLSNDIYPSMANNTQHMDVIFCRNVLMYFTPEKARETGEKFYHSLLDKGFLITSQVELIDEYFPRFSRVWYDKGLFYYKGSVPLLSNKPEKSVIQESVENQVISRKETIISRVKPKPAKAPVTIEKIPDPVPENLSPEDLYNQGLYQDCVYKVLEMIKKETDHVTLILLLVKSYANLGLLDKATEWGEKLVSVDPSPDNYLLFSNILMEMKDLERAVSNLKKLLYLDADHVMAHLFLGNLLYRLGNKSIGKKHLQNVIELLEPMHEKDIIPGSDGMTAGRIKEMAYRILH